MVSLDQHNHIVMYTRVATAMVLQQQIIYSHVHQRCNRVTSIDPDDPLTHWLRPSDPDNDPDVTRIKFF